MDRKLIQKAFWWTFSVASVFALALGSVVLSIIVGDWVYIHTDEAWLGWLVGALVMLAFIISLGIAVGSLLWIRNPELPNQKPEPPHITESMEKIFTDATKTTRD